MDFRDLEIKWEKEPEGEDRHGEGRSGEAAAAEWRAPEEELAAAGETAPEGSLEEYIDLVERYLGLERGRETLLDCEDWDLAAKLYSRGVPAHVVGRGIQAGAKWWRDGRPAFRPLGLSKLRQFRKAIEWEWKRYRESMTGGF